MKDATGELGSAVVVVTCIAILVAFFYFTIWPMIKQNFVAQTACEKAICEAKPNEDGLVKCIYEGQIIECNYKG